MGFDPMFGFVLDHGGVTRSLAMWSDRKAMGAGLLEGCPNGAWPYGNHCENLKRALKQDVSMPLRRTPLQTATVTAMHECMHQCTCLRWPPWSMGCSEAEMGSIYTYSSCTLQGTKCQ